MLHEELISMEAQMKNVLSKIRERFHHSGDKGSLVENEFRTFLREYLARRLAVGHGEVIDSLGNRSAQTDLIIADENHPFTFTEDLPGLFFIEGVVAAGEIKTVLDTEKLENSILNSQKFKKLKVTYSRGSQIFTNPSDRERFYSNPPWFIFAYESKLCLSTIAERLKEKSQSDTGVFTNLVDAVFVLGKGWVINFGDGQGAFQFLISEGISLPGWHWQEKDIALIELMTWLSAVMPRVLRYESILMPYLLPKDRFY